MARQGIPVGSPIEYPTVKIGQDTYKLRFELGAKVMLDNAGVALAMIPDLAKNPYAVGQLTLMTKLFAALVSHHFVAVGQPIPTFEYWAHRISDEEWAECLKAMPEAILKVMRPTVQLQESDATITETRQ